MGINTGDDAAVYQLSDDVALVQTVDFFPPIVDDPYQYGAIAAANSLSDVYAMGGRPIIALNIVCFPVALDREVLAEILRGGQDKATEAGALIVGGHTIDDAEPKYGLSVTGLVKPGEHVCNVGARPGDALILTKPLGTGIITTAGKAGRIGPEAMDEAVRVMSTLNAAASEAMLEVGVNACTDVTGFGVAGAPAPHGGRQRRIGRGAPFFRSHASPRRGIGGGRGWRPAARSETSTTSRLPWSGPTTSATWRRYSLCDAQTSGGLLMATSPDKCDALLEALARRGVEGAVVGGITEAAEKPLRVTR